MIAIGISRDEKVARLLRAMSRGEEIAEQAAAAQSRSGFLPLALQRATLAQARQERVHRAAFKAAARLFDCREHAKPTALDSALEQFRAEVTGDLQSRRVAATFIGVQGVLEGLGEAILVAIEAGAVCRSATFARFHRMILRQERSHQAIGGRALVCTATLRERETVDEAATRYLQLGEAILLAGADLVDTLNADAADFMATTREQWSSWLCEAMRPRNATASNA